MEMQPKSIFSPNRGLELAKAEVLVIEDEELMSALIQRYIQQFSQEKSVSFQTLKLESGWSLLTGDLSSVRIAVVDILLPQVNGADLIRHFRTHYPNMGIVPVTGMATSKLRRQIKESLPQGFDILEKPLRKDAFLEAFGRAYDFAHSKSLSPPPAPIEKPIEDALWTSAVPTSIPTAQFKRKIPGRAKAA